MEPIEVMELLTIAITLLLQLTGIPPMISMYQTGDTKNVPFGVFLVSGVIAQGMFHYGLMLQNGTLMFINSVGLVLQWTYVFLYLVLVQSKGKPLVYFLIAVGYMVSLYVYLYNIVLDEIAIAATIGGLSSLLCTLLICVPLVEIVQNVRNKHADGMPLIMLVGWVASASCWLTYGLMLNDPNVYAPNIPALLITLIKIVVVFLYHKPDEKLKTS